MKSITTFIFEQLKEKKLSEADAKKMLFEIAEATKKAESAAEKPIAIIGMAGRMPEAENLEEFWANLRNGVDSVREIPEERRKELEAMVKAFYGDNFGELEYLTAAYLDRVDLFDPIFFNIPPGEAKVICPEQRLFLEVAWESLEDAGYSDRELYGAKAGIFVGFTNTDYSKLIRGYEPTSVAGNVPSVTSARLAYIMNFSGPCPMIDTACSSSLVALHMACQALRSGDCEIALVGGVNIVLLPIKEYASNQMGIASPDGRCKTFDADANGVGGGEGVLSVVLKPLDKALKDRDHIYAVIKGSAVNNDGRSNGIAAPNALAQTRVIRDAWERAGISPETISYIEAHGTGTKLGDPIEIEGLTGAFRAHTAKTRFCPIGSLKTNIGHLDSAAGLSGLVKTVLALHHREIPPSLNFKTPNPFIDFANAPVYVNTEVRAWEAPYPRRAGVNSFGISGTNCHVLIEEGPEVRREPEIAGERLFTLSAKTPKSLWGLVERYRKFLTETTERFSDICFTANAGRGQYTYRLALVVKDMHDLHRKIELLATVGEQAEWQGLKTAEEIYYSHSGGNAGRGLQTSKAKDPAGEYKVEKDADLRVVASTYVGGTLLNWIGYYQNIDVRRVALPTYVFDHRRLWVDYTAPAEPSIYDQINRLGYEGQSPQGKETHTMTSISNAGSTQDTEAEVAAALVAELSEEELVYLKVRQVWTDVLGYDELLPEADFFELGGNSLNAMQIIAKIHRALNVRIPLEEFLNHPTLEGMAKFILTMDKNIYANIPAQPEREYYPVSSAQKRLFLICQHEEAQLTYNMPGSMIIEGPLQKERFVEAIGKLVERHEAFRTYFELKDGELMQRIVKDVECPVEYAELGSSEVEPIVVDFTKPFNLGKAPLLRVKLLKLSDEKHIFLFDMHHIISDGVSFSILIRDFAYLYDNKVLEPLRIQYKDYSVWQHNLWADGTLEKEEEFWFNNLQGELPVLNLPTDFPRPVERDYRGGIKQRYLSPELTQRIRELASAEGVTNYMFLLAAFNIFLNKYTNQEDILVGTPIAGRPHADLENIIGMFVNTLVMRNYPSHEKRFVDFLEEVRERTLMVFENQDYQFDTLVDRLGIIPEKNQNPIFDVVFIMQNFVNNMEANFEELQLNMRSNNTAQDAKFDLSMSAYDNDLRMNLQIEYSLSLFSETTIERMLDDFSGILEQITANPEKLIGDIEIESGLMVLKTEVTDDEDFNF